MAGGEPDERGGRDAEDAPRDRILEEPAVEERVQDEDEEARREGEPERPVALADDAR